MFYILYKSKNCKDSEDFIEAGGSRITSNNLRPSDNCSMILGSTDENISIHDIVGYPKRLSLLLKFEDQLKKMIDSFSFFFIFQVRQKLGA